MSNNLQWFNVHKAVPLVCSSRSGQQGKSHGRFFEMLTRSQPAQCVFHHDHDHSALIRCSPSLICTGDHAMQQQTKTLTQVSTLILNTII